jgi:hypothetical protein
MLRAGATLIVLLLGSIFRADASEPIAIFDTHLHYDQSHVASWNSDQIIQVLNNNDVRYAAITSTPPELVLDLHKYNPEQILPVLGVYQSYEDKQYWHWDPTLPGRLEAYLKQHVWYAIGEIHLFSPHKRSPIFHSIMKLAGQYRLPVIVHADPAVIDSLYDKFPEARVIWAHAGAYPYPPLIRDYLERYPLLTVDLSMRNERIAPEGELAEEWELLFLEHPDRFMVGVDTFSSQRWSHYDQVSTETRNWLVQLPTTVAQQIAMGNALRVFGIESN